MFGRRPVVGYVRAGRSGKVKIRAGDDPAAKVREAVARDRAVREFGRWLRQERGWR